MKKFSSYLTVELDVEQGKANLVSGGNLHSSGSCKSVYSGVQDRLGRFVKCSAIYLVRMRKESVNFQMESLDLVILLACLS